MKSSGLELIDYSPADRSDLFQAFSEVVNEGRSYPQAPPLTDQVFEETWLTHTKAVVVARLESAFVGAYYLKPNFSGRAAHIGNAGYVVISSLRGRGFGGALVEDSFNRARREGFDALMYNLVFESNPARSLYLRMGFAEIGRIPQAVDDETAIMYWKRL